MNEDNKTLLSEDDIECILELPEGMPLHLLSDGTIAIGVPEDEGMVLIAITQHIDVLISALKHFQENYSIEVLPSTIH